MIGKINYYLSKKLLDARRAIGLGPKNELDFKQDLNGWARLKLPLIENKDIYKLDRSDYEVIIEKFIESLDRISYESGIRKLTSGSMSFGRKGNYFGVDVCFASKDILSYLDLEKKLQKEGYDVEFSRKASFMYPHLGPNYERARSIKLPKFGEKGWLS